MSKFSDFFHHLIAKAESTESTFVADSTRFFAKVEGKLGPLGQSLVQLAVTEAALVAAPWQEKLFNAVTLALKSFDQHKISADINDIVAAITVILDDLKGTVAAESPAVAAPSTAQAA